MACPDLGRYNLRFRHRFVKMVLSERDRYPAWRVIMRWFSASFESVRHRLPIRAAGVSAAIALSRVAGYIRDQVLARYLGTTHEADAFNIAFTLPNTLRLLFGEGAMANAFVRKYTEWRTHTHGAREWELPQKFMTDLILVMACVVLIGELLAPWIIPILAPGFQTVPGKLEWTIFLYRWMVPFAALISLAALSAAILNTHKVFAWPQAMPIVFNLTIIVGALAFARHVPHPSLVFAIAVVVGGGLQWMLQMPPIWKRGFRFQWRPDFRDPTVQRMFRDMVPGFVGTGILHFNLVVGQIYASLLAEGTVAALYFAIRVRELTIGVIAVAFADILLAHLSEYAVRADWHRFRHTLSDALVWVAAWNSAAALGLMWLSEPIMHALFEYGRFDVTSRHMAASALFWFALSVPAYSLGRVLEKSFYSVNEVWIPIRPAFYAMCAYILALIHLAPRYAIAGIAMSSAIASWVRLTGLVGLYLYRFRRFAWGVLLRGVWAIPAGLSAMVGVLWLIDRYRPYPFTGTFPARIAHLGIYIIPAALAFWCGFALIYRFMRRRDPDPSPSVDAAHSRQ